jgi:hypothetical protein
LHRFLAPWFLPRFRRAAPSRRSRKRSTEAIAPAAEPPTAAAAPPSISSLGDALDDAFGEWAAELLIIESTGAPIEIAADGEWVQLRIPIRIRIDADRAAAWSAAATDRLRTHLGAARAERLLVQGEAGPIALPSAVELPVRALPPFVHMERAALAMVDRAGEFAIAFADRPSWGSEVESFRASRQSLLEPVLRRLAAPRLVEMLALTRSGEVIYGATLPLIPAARATTGAPQALICPWWIRDRRDENASQLRWRNAQQWLAPQRSLATAMLERPESLGDLLFLPMLGCQLNASTPPIAVGGLEMRIAASVPREIADRISELVFRVAR